MLKTESHLARRVRQLLRDRTPENRMLALAQLEATLSLWPDALVDELVPPLARDQVHFVATRARAVLARHRRERILPGRRRGRPLLGSVTAADLAGVPALAAADLAPVRQRLTGRLSGHLVKLAARIDEAGAGALPRDLAALGALGWPGAMPTIRKTLKYPMLQMAAAQALERIGDRAAQEAICAIVRSAGVSPAGRGAALEALGSCSASEAIPLLQAALKGDAVERLVALRALSTLSSARAWPLLLTGVADPEPMVAVAAVRGLAAVADETFAGPLIAAATHPDERVRATVAAAFGRVVTPEARETVLGLCQDAVARVAANAIEASLGFQNDFAEARRFYFDLVRSPHLRVRGNAIVLLWPFNGEAAFKVLKTMLRSQKPGERATGYWCASRVGSPEAVRELVEAALPEDDARALDQALDALDALDRPDLLAPVRRALAGPGARMRIRAAAVLGRVGKQAELGLLLQHLRPEPDARVKSAILRTVAQLSPEEALSRLPKTGEPDADRTIANVVDGLGEAGQTAALPYLAPMLDARAARIRGSAVVAMVSLGALDAADRLDELLERAPATACWVLTELARRLTPSGLEANPALAEALASTI